MGIPTKGNLVVPVVLWGGKSPQHTISAIALAPDLQTVITGSTEGQICFWEFTSDHLSVTPKFMLYGHCGSVTCIAAASFTKPHYVSASSTGEMCLWDVKDGRCIENSKTSYINTCMQLYKFDVNKSPCLICNGTYPEILLVNPETLQLMCSLVARVHPDWINALCALKPPKAQDDIILAITKSGTIKMWSVGMQSGMAKHIYEDESKQIRCIDALLIKCCPYNQRIVLIVCSKSWQIFSTSKRISNEKIYDAGEFSLLCSESCTPGSHWCGGDFIAVDKVIIWNNLGQAFLYKLPANKHQSKVAKPSKKLGANPERNDYHSLVGSKAVQQASPSLYCILDTNKAKIFEEASHFVCQKKAKEESYFVVRADNDGSISWWSIDSLHIPQRKDDHIPTIHSLSGYSIRELWAKTKPVGLLDLIKQHMHNEASVTCTLYVETSGQMICGLSDGNIIIIPLLQTIKFLLLQSTDDNKNSLPVFKVLTGHKARVNCLLYPNALESRYNPNHLLSGSSDFAVNLWDISSCQLIHSFNVHSGEVSHLYIPPANCNTRILSCVCSVGNDHSVALLSLKEKRCLVFASRHMFPVVAIKWRPVEDFMIISCADSTAYVWQMETGLLDRVVLGVTAVEVLKACEEAAHRITLAESQSVPRISVVQAIKRGNVASFKNLAQQTIQQLENLVDDEEDITTDTEETAMSFHIQPLLVEGLKTCPDDQESHILLFDTEALIVQLLCDEYGISSSEFLGLDNSQKKRGEVEEKISEFLSAVKETAGSLGQMALAGTVGKRETPSNYTNENSTLSASPRKQNATDKKENKTWSSLASKALDVAQLFVSILHAWRLDPDLDKLCIKKLGLEKITQPVCFGLLSHGGQMALMLPSAKETDSGDNVCKAYWEASSALTTQHLLSVISLANTLMSMNNATFVKQKESEKGIHPSSGDGGSQYASDMSAVQAQIKQGWSLLAALHCILLPDLVNSSKYEGPQLHLLANRWQDRCLEVREASQALLLAELKRIGTDGRMLLIREWHPYMPLLIDDSDGGISLAEPSEDTVTNDEDQPVKSKTSNEKRQLQATAIVMLGVIGAEFGKEIEPKKNASKFSKRQSVDGFGLSNSSLAWHTSKALAFLLLHPQQCKLGLCAPIRRAAIDLLGRGFSVWQPYIDVSSVLLGLLEICIDADKILPSTQSGLPLTPAADACRTARHALSLIATAQPATFLTCMAKEVARYNAAAQNPQSGTTQNANVLIKAKPEILKIIELLIDKQPNDVADLLVETVDVAVHCLDANCIKNKGLQETFPALCRFSMVSYCTTSRRICVGSKNGSIAFYEMKQSKAQSIPFQASPTSAMILYLKASAKETIAAHRGSVSAVAFSEDGRYLASFSPVDAKIHFWQTGSQSLFGIGTPHTKCIKSFSVPFKNPSAPQPNVTKGGRLKWMDPRTISLVLPDGTESIYKV